MSLLILCQALLCLLLQANRCQASDIVLTSDSPQPVAAARQLSSFEAFLSDPKRFSSRPQTSQGDDLVGGSESERIESGADQTKGRNLAYPPRLAYGGPAYGSIYNRQPPPLPSPPQNPQLQPPPVAGPPSSSYYANRPVVSWGRTNGYQDRQYSRYVPSGSHYGPPSSAYGPSRISYGYQQSYGHIGGETPTVTHPSRVYTVYQLEKPDIKMYRTKSLRYPANRRAPVRTVVSFADAKRTADRLDDEKLIEPEFFVQEQAYVSVPKANKTSLDLSIGEASTTADGEDEPSTVDATSPAPTTSTSVRPETKLDKLKEKILEIEEEKIDDLGAVKSELAEAVEGRASTSDPLTPTSPPEQTPTNLDDESGRSAADPNSNEEGEDPTSVDVGSGRSASHPTVTPKGDIVSASPPGNSANLDQADGGEADTRSEDPSEAEEEEEQSEGSSESSPSSDDNNESTENSDSNDSHQAGSSLDRSSSRVPESGASGTFGGRPSEDGSEQEEGSSESGAGPTTGVADGSAVGSGEGTKSIDSTLPAFGDELVPSLGLTADSQAIPSDGQSARAATTTGGGGSDSDGGFEASLFMPTPFGAPSFQGGQQSQPEAVSNLEGRSVGSSSAGGGGGGGGLSIGGLSASSQPLSAPGLEVSGLMG